MATKKDEKSAEEIQAEKEAKAKAEMKKVEAAQEESRANVRSNGAAAAHDAEVIGGGFPWDPHKES